MKDESVEPGANLGRIKAGEVDEWPKESEGKFRCSYCGKPLSNSSFRKKCYHCGKELSC